MALQAPSESLPPIEMTDLPFLDRETSSCACARAGSAVPTCICATASRSRGICRSCSAFLALAPEVPVRTTVTRYPLEQAEQALADLLAGAFEGAAVLVP